MQVQIYIIYNTFNTDIYVGGTMSNSLNSALAYHKRQAKLGSSKRSLYNAMRQFGCHKFRIRLLRSVPSLSKKQMQNIIAQERDNLPSIPEYNKPGISNNLLQQARDHNQAILGEFEYGTDSEDDHRHPPTQYCHMCETEYLEAEKEHQYLLSRTRGL